jgi:selenocysteine-specific elongation factor
MSAFIIGTAGHIDHGKTSLVKALTGIDLDSAPEEQQRGITISLGFTSLLLPSGREAACIDVPGHEKFVRTMIAGASGIDAVLLCISATEGIMPQTREHVDILHLLQIPSGIIAITMCDLADEELLEMVLMEIEDLVEGTFLENSPIIQTAAGDQKQGILELLQAIDGIENIPQKIDGPFRLPIDRVFTQKGFGAVVTGTSRNGTLIEGQEVQIIPENLQGRVRNLQVHGRKVSSVGPNERVAINLSGINHNQISRGSIVIASDSIPISSIIDVSYTHLNEAPTLQNGSRLRLLSGSNEVLAKLEILDADELIGGQQYHLQLRLQHPSVFLPNDRFILRRESPLETLGGGIILDPFAIKIKRRNRNSQIDYLKRINNGDKKALLERRGTRGIYPTQAKILSIQGSNLGDFVYEQSIIDTFKQQIVERLQNWHTENPLKIGILSKELHNISVLFLSSKAFDILVKELIAVEEILSKGQFLRHVDFIVNLNTEQETQINTTMNRLLQSEWEGINISEITELPRELLQYLIDSEKVIRIQSQILHPKMIEKLITCLRSFFLKHKEMTTAEFKEITKLSRKYLIPLLEWCDHQGVTIRKGNSRVFRK